MKKLFVLMLLVIMCAVSPVTLTDMIGKNGSVSACPGDAASRKLTLSSGDTGMAAVHFGTAKAIAEGAAAASNHVSSAYGIMAVKDSVEMEVQMVSVLVENNHVGNNWSASYTINNAAYQDNMTISLKRGDTVSVCSVIIEEDKYADIGEKSSSHEVTDDELSTGFSIEQKIVVTENKGRYKGRTATWAVIYTFTPVGAKE